MPLNNENWKNTVLYQQNRTFYYFNFVLYCTANRRLDYSGKFCSKSRFEKLKILRAQMRSEKPPGRRRRTRRWRRRWKDDKESEESALRARYETKKSVARR
jgi:hypothetical protein